MKPRSVALAALLLLLFGSSFAQKVSPKDLQRVASEGKKAASDGMKDPNSVQFRGLYVSRSRGDGDSQAGAGLLVLCGEMNAKNGYGAYVGFRRFIAAAGTLLRVAKDDEGTAYEAFDDKLCGQKIAAVK